MFWRGECAPALSSAPAAQVALLFVLRVQYSTVREYSIGARHGDRSHYFCPRHGEKRKNRGEVMTGNQIINPYALKSRKDSKVIVSEKEKKKVPSVPQPSKPATTRHVQASSTNAVTKAVTKAVTTAVTNQQRTKKSVSLKNKLKKEIEDLKREKLLQQQRLEERKRQKLEKKKQAKLEEEQRKQAKLEEEQRKLERKKQAKLEEEQRKLEEEKQKLLAEQTKTPAAKSAVVTVSPPGSTELSTPGNAIHHTSTSGEVMLSSSLCTQHVTPTLGATDLPSRAAAVPPTAAVTATASTAVAVWSSPLRPSAPPTTGTAPVPLSNHHPQPAMLALPQPTFVEQQQPQQPVSYYPPFQQHNNINMHHNYALQQIMMSMYNNPQQLAAYAAYQPTGYGTYNQRAVNPFNQGAVNTCHQGAANTFNQGVASPCHQGVANPFNQGAVNPFHPGAVNPFHQGSANPFNQGTTLYPPYQQQRSACPPQMSLQKISAAPRPRRPRQTKTDDQFSSPLRPPAPFGLTHELFPQTILLVKQPGGGFGLTIQKVVESALVVPDERLPEKLPKKEVKNESDLQTTDRSAKMTVVNSTAVGDTDTVTDKNNTTTLDTTNVVTSSVVTTDKNDQAVEAKASAKPRRRNRKRMLFAALQVLNATEQNSRTHPRKNNDMLLQVGDLILTIQGQETAGLTFAQAVALFSTTTPIEDGLYEITVARRRPPPPPKIVSQALSTLPKSEKAPRFNGPLREAERLALARTIVQVVTDPKRVLGRSIVLDESIVQSLATTVPPGRTLDTWQGAWTTMVQSMEMRMEQRALEHWKNEWMLEPREIREAMPHLTDAQRSEWRARPRPPMGCRCGSSRHDYVNDQVCPLYSNIRRLVEDIEQGDDDKAKAISQLPRDLNAVETAFKDRFVRMKEEESAQEAEAAFVGRMEEIQLLKCGKAIFAPSLTAIVLSALMDLEPKFRDCPAIPPVEEVQEKPVLPTPKAEPDDDDDDDDSDDDDIPLTALGKRETTTNSQNVQGNKKKARGEPPIRQNYIAALLRYVSDRWGHVYREPSDSDKSWYVRICVMHHYYPTLLCRLKASFFYFKGDGKSITDNLSLQVIDQRNR
jgi:hypothetical protein